MRRQFTDDATEHEIPNFIVRLLAMIYDSLIVIAIWFLVGAIAVALNDGEAIDTLIGQSILKSSLFCATFLFFGYSWTKKGQTVGMIAWRLRAQTTEGLTLSWSQSLIRFVGAVVSFAVVGRGFFVTLFTNEKLTWHERWSNSVTVRLPKR